MLPGVSRLAKSRAGTPDSARYCYSVFLRHLVSVVQATGDFRRKCVAELGPGDSLGVGLAALLCGADRYYAFDKVTFTNPASNLLVFRDLAGLFESRAAIPDDDEFPNVYPRLDSYGFPSDILDDELLSKSLFPGRIDRIREALCGTNPLDKSIEIRYFAPWDSDGSTLPSSVDWLFSQAVLEHVDDPPVVYAKLSHRIRAGGVMSHQIDYTSHGLTRDWDGYRAIPDSIWRIIKGRRTYLINREPHSGHQRYMEAAGFQILATDRLMANHLDRQFMQISFRNLQDDDLSTAGAFVVAVRGP